MTEITPERESTRLLEAVSDSGHAAVLIDLAALQADGSNPIEARDLLQAAGVNTEIDLDAAYEATGADRDTTEILCGFVLGHQGDVSALPEALQRKEQASDRKPVSDFVFKGGRVSG